MKCFVDPKPSPAQDDAWTKLRGALKDVFKKFGGGEAYLLWERGNFLTPDESE